MFAAGTDADVFIVLYGREAVCTQQKSLCVNKRERRMYFERGAEDMFIVEVRRVNDECRNSSFIQLRHLRTRCMPVLECAFCIVFTRDLIFSQVLMLGRGPDCFVRWTCVLYIEPENSFKTFHRDA